MGNPSWDDSLAITEPNVATVLLADVENAEELDFNVTGVIALFQNKNYRATIWVGITSIISRKSVIVLSTGARPDLVRTPFIALRRHQCVRFLHNMSF